MVRERMPDYFSPTDTRALQEVVAGDGHFEAAVGFALACAAQACVSEKHPRLIVWIRQDVAAHEAGDSYGPGLAALGIDPGELIVVRTRTFKDTLRASLDVLRCPAVGVGLIETITAIDLTASRRLKLAAQKSGAVPILIRHVDAPVSNAVSQRWRVRAAPRLGNEESADWPEVVGASFQVELVKHSAGLAGTRWCVEWDRERRHLKKALSRPVAAVPVSRSLAA